MGFSHRGIVVLHTESRNVMTTDPTHEDEKAATQDAAIKEAQEQLDSWPDPETVSNDQILDWARAEFATRADSHDHGLKYAKASVQAMNGITTLLGGVAEENVETGESRRIRQAMELTVVQQAKLAALCRRAYVVIGELA